MTYPGLLITGIIQMQIGNPTNYDYDRMRMDQDLPYTYGGQYSAHFTAPNLS